MHLQDAFLYSIGILQTYFPCQSEGFTVQPFKMDTKVDVEDEIVIIIFLPCLNLNWLLHRYMKFYIQCNEWSQTNKRHFFQQIMFSNEITMRHDCIITVTESGPVPTGPCWLSNYVTIHAYAQTRCPLSPQVLFVLLNPYNIGVKNP